MNLKLLIIGLFLCTVAAFSQSKLRKANRDFADLAYTEAAKEYEAYLAEEKNPKPEVIANAAEAYYNIGNMGSALRWYEKLMEMPTIDKKLFRHYILALKSEERYEKADELLWKDLEADGNENLKKRFAAQKQHLDSLNKLPAAYTLINIAANTNKADFGTAFYGSKIVYASGKDTVRDGAKTYSWNQQPYLTLFIADRDTAMGNFIKEKKFLPKAQTEYHNAAPAFSPDLKTIYFSANNVTKSDKLINDGKGTNNIFIIKGQIQGERLIKPESLIFNNKEYSVGQPAVSPDGKWLFFASDMPGGYGETDIYIAPIFSDGKLGDPVNAGPAINTTDREMFPFITDAVLYFSSDGHYGLGGLDVFKSVRTAETTFAEPQNIGKPINSNLDDFAYIVDKTGKYGYVSSNRAGGKGDDDIYYITLAKQNCTQTITGIATDQKNGSPLNGVIVKATDADSKIIATVITKADGTYLLTVPCDVKVTIDATKPAYTIDRKEPVIAATPQPLKVDFILRAYADLVKSEDNVEKIAINPIYFDFDQYYITPQAAAELDKVVYVMQNFPEIVIKIESHTDSRGNDDYNLKLSDDRAKSTFSYIVSKGILPSRIESVKGYGETQLKNKCSNEVPCSDDEHQLNRRSDFIIVKK